MEITEQMEIFPQSSRFNSTHAIRERTNRAADKVKANKKKGAPIKDITGERFGDLVIVCQTDERSSGAVVYIARCDCGKEIKVTSSHVKRFTTHCGCKGVGKSKKPMPGALGIDSKFGAYTGTLTNTPGNTIYAQYRQSAKSRGHRFDITRADFLRMIQQDCHYCGAAPSNRREFGDVVFEYNGLDRLDSAKGYSVDNCVPCCRTCNVAKNDLHVDDFRAWIVKVYEKWAKTA